MKKSTTLKESGRSIILLIAILPLLIIGSCQKEDSVILNAEVVTEADSPQLKSADVSDYLLELIQSIETMVADGLISKGNANALISKIENAIKSNSKGNTNSTNGQLGALINELEDYIDKGVLTEEQGESLIEVAEIGVAVINGEPIVKDGLIAYYPFNGSANDESGNNRNGESVNIIFTANRNENIISAAYFNGESQIRIPSIGQTGGSFSISLWYKTVDGGTILRTDNIYMGADITNNQYITSWFISIGLYSPAGNPVYLDNTWHHVVITHDANEERIITYFDGVIGHNRPESGYFLGNNDNIYLGYTVKEYDFGFPYIKPFYIGAIDDLYLFNRAISATEVEQLYNYPN